MCYEIEKLLHVLQTSSKFALVNAKINGNFFYTNEKNISKFGHFTKIRREKMNPSLAIPQLISVKIHDI